MKMSLLAAAIFCAIPALSQAGYVEGTIQQVFAGEDQWYGVRFYLNITNDQTNAECNPAFVYSEPEAGSGHKEKVAVFTAAYLTGKTVLMTVSAGRNGYCKLREGHMR